MANIQLQIQDLVKLANIVNTELTDIETTLFQSGKTQKEQIGGDIYSILGKLRNVIHVRNRLTTEPVMLKVCNVKLSFDIWLVLYIYFILYFWQYMDIWNTKHITYKCFLLMNLIIAKTKKMRGLKTTLKWYKIHIKNPTIAVLNYTYYNLSLWIKTKDYFCIK